jgi:hypothetical protein
MAGLPRLKPGAGEAAQAVVVAEVRERAAAGEVELIDPDDMGEG